MKNLRGSHTSFTPLSQEIFEILTKDKKIRISPGFITRKNVQAKQVSVKLKDETTSILCEVLMKGSKQSLRIYNTNIKEIKKLLKAFCENRQILLK